MRNGGPRSTGSAMQDTQKELGEWGRLLMSQGPQNNCVDLVMWQHLKLSKCGCL